MSALSSGDLTSMRSTLETTLPDSGTIMRRAVSDDGMGGQVESWAAAGTVSCRVSPLDISAGQEVVAGEALTTVAERVITIPANTTVYTADRIACGGHTYELRNVRAPRSYEISRRVNAVEVG